MTGIRRLTRIARRSAQHKARRSGIFAAVVLCAVPVVLLSAATPASAQKGSTAGVGSQFELLYWQSVAASEDPTQLQAYLAQYPDGTFAALARAKIATLARQSAPAPAPTVAPTPVSAPVPAPVVPAPEPVAAYAAAAAAAAAATNDSGNELGPKSDTTGPDPVAVILGIPTAAVVPPPPTPQQPHVALPPRPQFAPTPPVNLPGRFCSATERNDFYDAVYRPSKDVADHNNQTAISHMQKLQALYDALGRQGDTNAQNAVSAEARSWQGVAASVYQSSMGYDGLFNRLMAVPIAACPGISTP